VELVRPDQGPAASNLGQRRSEPAKESATVAATPTTSARFGWRGGRGRLWGPSQLVGEAGEAPSSGGGRRPPATVSA
jgi:hypothetical protein